MLGKWLAKMCLVALASITASADGAKANFIVTNRTSEPIRVALTWAFKGADGVVSSQGWFVIPPNQSHEFASGDFMPQKRGHIRIYWLAIDTPRGPFQFRSPGGVVGRRWGVMRDAMIPIRMDGHKIDFSDSYAFSDAMSNRWEAWTDYLRNGGPTQHRRVIQLVPNGVYQSGYEICIQTNLAFSDRAWH